VVETQSGGSRIVVLRGQFARTATAQADEAAQLTNTFRVGRDETGLVPVEDEDGQSIFARRSMVRSVTGAGATLDARDQKRSV
jgi:hypothetical protein